MSTSYNPSLPLSGIEQFKTRAPGKVWKDSTQRDVKFAPWSMPARLQAFRAARKIEKKTAITRQDAFGRVSTQGALGRAGMEVFRALLFDFMDAISGRLVPGLEAIAKATGYSVRTVIRALARLRKAKLLDWERRCSGRMIDGHYTLEQETNAYHVQPVARWRHAEPEPPAPDAAAWGKAPTVAGLGIERGDGARRVQTVLEGAAAGGDSLAAHLARIGAMRAKL